MTAAACATCGHELSPAAVTCSRCLAPVSTPAPVAAGRLVLTYQITGERIEIGDEDRAILGRESYGAKVLGKIPQVSARHCVIERTAVGYVVTDMRSTHGTFVGDRSCAESPRPLLDGGTLYLGREPFAVSCSGVQAAADPAPAEEPAVTERRCSGCHEVMRPEDTQSMAGGALHVSCNTFNNS